MEALPLPTPDTQDWADQFDAALRQQRERTREFLAAHAARLKHVETQLATHLERLADELAENRRNTTQAKAEVQERLEQIARESANLRALQEELAARQAQWEEVHERANRQQEALVAEVRRQQEEIEQRHAKLVARQTEMDAAEARLHHDQQALALAQAQHQAEVEQLAALRARLDARQAEQPAEASPPVAGDAPASEDFRRRYEMALDDLRELKTENARLQERLARSPAAAAQTPQSGRGNLSWEAEKVRILAALESDFDESDEDARRQRLTLEEVVATTDRVLAEKDREIAELRQLLEQQSSSLGSVAVGAAALGQIFDSDAIIREQREALGRLQEEWREKLRQAEIEISVERAKIARERSQLEERLRALEAETAKLAEHSDGPAAANKPVRGRWLARLGLKELEE